MAKYDVTRACGHQETVALFGKEKDRQWRIENVEAMKLCYDCYQAEREKENAKAAAEAVEIGLPELTGSEKQIGWAETIRLGAVERFDAFLVQLKEDGERAKQDVSEQVDLAREIMEHILATRTQASWWIDNRGVSTSDLALQLLLEKNIESTKKAKAEAAPAALEAKAEATVRPESPVTETVAEIRTLETAVEVDFPEKRDDFREIVKALGYRWTGNCWQRKLVKTNGDPQDRAAEAGHKLLAAGFPIRIYDEQVRQKAISGGYEPEQTRWIYRRLDGAPEYPGWFAINWGRTDDFYEAARKLKGSRWSKPSVVVPPEQFEQVLDFAQMYGFSLTETARDLAEEARQAKEAALVVKVEPVQGAASVAPGSKPPALEVPEKVEVDDEFKD